MLHRVCFLIALMLCALPLGCDRDESAASDEESAAVDVAKEAEVAVTPVASDETVYWTHPGLEPDKCVAAWLLVRVVSPGAKVVFTDQPVDGTPFDVPGCDLARQIGIATSDLVCKRYDITGAFIESVVAVVREVEMTPWSMNDDPFFLKVRSGLAEAVNHSTSDEECLAEALDFLDQLKEEHAGSVSP